MDPSAIKGPGITAVARGVDRANTRRPMRAVLAPSQAVNALLPAEAPAHEPHGPQALADPAPAPLPDPSGVALLDAREREQDGRNRERSALLRVRAYTRQGRASDAEPRAETDVAV